MPYETTVTLTQFPVLRDLPVTGSPLMLPPRTGWVLGKFVLAGLLVIYLVGWAQDFDRVRRLEAAPAPALKVITKYQAWQRVYRAPARKAIWPNTLLSMNR